MFGALKPMSREFMDGLIPIGSLFGGNNIEFIADGEPEAIC
jgi:hypothetical protein